MPGFYSIAINEDAAVIEVTGMQIQAVAAWNQAEGFFNIAAKLADCARLSRIIARCLYSSAREFGALRFKSSNIVSLPMAASTSTLCSA
jgi:hypothetical protein